MSNPAQVQHDLNHVSTSVLLKELQKRVGIDIQSIEVHFPDQTSSSCACECDLIENFHDQPMYIVGEFEYYDSLEEVQSALIDMWNEGDSLVDYCVYQVDDEFVIVHTDHEFDSEEEAEEKADIDEVVHEVTLRDLFEIEPSFELVPSITE